MRAPCIASAAFASGAKRAARSRFVRARGDVAPGQAVADDDEHIRRRKLRVERRAQRSGRHAAAIAGSIVRVDDDERQVGRDAAAVEAVVENDDGRAMTLRQVCARHSVCADDRRRDARKQQRFVADLVGAVTRQVHDEGGRSAAPAAIAPREKGGALSHRLETAARGRWRAASCRRRPQSVRRRRSSANWRAARRTPIACRDGAVERAERRQEPRRRAVFTPEGGRAHSKSGAARAAHCWATAICAR